MRQTIALVSLLFLSSSSFAVDLTKIERSIRKEPAYQSKTPRYCLLVFGPEAKTRIWLVLDGKRLFVDRNGNGDLTDDGESVSALEGLKQVEENVYEMGDIREGARTHKNLTLWVRKIDYLANRFEPVKQFLAKTPGAKGYHLATDIDMPGWKGDGEGGRVLQVASYLDNSGVLAFANEPKDAPILHFGGPWQVLVHERIPFTIGREADLALVVGTRGLGAGSTVVMAYNSVIPENRSPRVEITYPPKNPGEKPVKQLYELKERC
jgi:hypothetical protein